MQSPPGTTNSGSPTPRLRGEELRWALRRVAQAWLFGATWMYIVTGATLTRYAKLLNVSAFGFGLMAALPFAGALMQLPASYFIERYGHRKLIFIGAGIIHRGLWIAAAAIPWLAPPAWWGPILIGLLAVSWATGHMLGPIWVSWMADLVPARIRGRYFSRRTQIGQFVGIIITVIIGEVLDIAELRGESALRTTAAVALALAGLSGIADMFHFFQMPELSPKPPDPSVSVWQLIREPLLDRQFRYFLGFTATMTFAIGYVGQFCWLYLFDVVGVSNTRANVLLVFVPLVVQMLSFPIWGQVLDRMGCKPVLILAGLVTVPGSVAWVFVTSETWLPAYIVIMIVTAAWPGVELANFNLLLSIGDQQHGSGRRKSSGYAAVNSTVAALAGVLSGLFGGAVAQALNGWRTTILGWTVTYHGVLFLISGGLRVLALLWLTRLEGHGTQSTRAAFRYLGSHVFSNVQQAIFIPGRLLASLGRWTFTFDQTGPSFRWLRGRRGGRSRGSHR